MKKFNIQPDGSATFSASIFNILNTLDGEFMVDDFRKEGWSVVDKPKS